MADYELTTQHESTLYYPVVLNGVKLEQQRSGSPAKLTFSYYDDGKITLEEGDPVRFLYKGQNVFFGYVFTKQRTKNRQVSVTAYDQLRYLKNKFTYVFTNKTATEIIKAISSDYGINASGLTDTGYKIPSLIEENQTAFDIILDALDETLTNTETLYILYDDFGNLTLKSLDDMALDLLIDEDTTQDFNFQTSIDQETYNKIVLYYVDEETNDRIPFVAKDDANIDKWGLLQYFEEVKVDSIGQSKADALLQLYNQKTKTLTLTGAFGDIRVRGGSLIVAKLNLVDTKISNYLLVEKVVHNFNNDLYTMDLTINGTFGGD